MPKSPRFYRWVAAFDNHGDRADPGTLKAFFEFVKWWRPDHRIHGGDNWDFRWIRGKASDQERREKTQEDFDAGMDFLKQYKPDVFLRGNHDERLWKAADSDDGKLADLAAYMILDIRERIGTALMLPYHKRLGVHDYHGRTFLHGFHCGLTATRQTALIYGNSCFGHVHSFDQHTAPRLGAVSSYSSGCLCATDLDYNSGQPNTLRQENGWLYGLAYPGMRETVVWQARKMGAHFFLPSEWREASA